MSSSPRPDFTSTLRVLSRHRVDYIVVGGVCAVLQGAPINTFDLDLVHSRAPENIQRLLAALQELDAHYRLPHSRKIRPDQSHLASPGHQLLITKFGPLDLLGTLGEGEDYEFFLPRSTDFPLSDDLTVRVLDLDELIRVKQQAGRDKDKLALPVLLRTLQEKSKGS